MVASHRQTLEKVTAAICPECHASALYRSHTTSAFEEKRKQFGSKRPYRCHKCQWRGWLEDAMLRYSAEGMKQKTRASAQEDVDIPDISLESPSHRNHDDVQEDGVEETAWLSNGRGADPEAADAPDSPRPSAPQSETQAAPEFPDDSIARGDAESPEELPRFEHHAQEPVSRKVSPGFHHRSRHKTLACPKCGEQALYRSRSRGVSENLRKKLTNRRPYRCHRCGWRDWLSKGF